MSSPVALVIFEGGPVSSVLEESFRIVRKGAVLDQVSKAQQAGLDQIVLCTSYPDLGEELRPLGVAVEIDQIEPGQFHFGQLLQKTIAKFGLQKVLYMGGAAAPLISVEELRFMAEVIAADEQVVTANNYYSADIIGFSPASVLQRIPLPDIDNSLAMLLAHYPGFRYIPQQRTLGLNFDLDTPADLLTLAAHPGVGPHTRRAVEQLNLDVSRCQRIKEVIGNPAAQMTVFGRVGAPLFQYLDEQTRCRIRLFSEERGMKALGRDQRGEVVSLVGHLLEVMGFSEFFAFLSTICDAALLDTRVLFAHLQWQVSQTDRFASDLGLLDQITHPMLRSFTEAAFAAPIPILLGGHSLVTGGIWALIDASHLESGRSC